MNKNLESLKLFGMIFGISIGLVIAVTGFEYFFGKIATLIGLLAVSFFLIRYCIIK